MYIKQAFSLSIFTVLLFSTLPIFAQLSESGKFRSDLVAMAPQPDCPLLLTLTDIDQSYPSLLKVNFSVKNVGRKKIDAYVIDTQISGIQSTFHTDFLSPLNIGQTINTWNPEPKKVLTQDSKITLSISYILFTDGTSWGTGAKNELDLILGFVEGSKNMLSELYAMMKTDKPAVVRLMEQENFEIKTSPTDTERQSGYLLGRRAIWNQLQPIYKKFGIEMLPLEPAAFYSSTETIFMPR